MSEKWGTYATAEGCEIYEIQGGMLPRGKTIAYVVGQDNKQWVTRAHMIASAPELIAACKLADDLICGRLSGTDPENTIVLPALRAAIAKAEGRAEG
jgi:hypothetical protein